MHPILVCCNTCVCTTFLHRPDEAPLQYACPTAMVNTHTMSRSSRSVLNTFIVGVGDRTGVNAHSTGVLVEGAALDEMVSDEMVSDEMVSDEMVSDEMVSETAAG